MPKFRDLAGHKFGQLTAISIDGKDTTGKTTWRCKCECGNESRHTMLNLVKGIAKSCGHLRHESRCRSDLSGLKFGSLTAIKPFDKLKWVCRCDCGNIINVRTIHLKRLHSTSCGCRKNNRIKTDAIKAIGIAPSLGRWNKIVISDAGCCDSCGSTIQLQAHHIIPKDIMPSMYFNLENGACLCKNCHKQVHNLIRQGNTPGMSLILLFKEHNPDIFECFPILGGLEDLKKCQHYIEKLIEKEDSR